MAKKPDGAAAGTQRVTFTKGAAERIGRVVREVESGNRDLGPIEWGPRGVGGSSGRVFRVCTFTGAWPIGASKTVTFKHQTATPNTVSATNLFFPITNTATANARDCAIAKDGTAWFLIDVRLAERTAVFVTGTAATSRLTDVTLSASLNTSACTITIGKTLVTASTILVTGTVTGTYLTVEV